MKVYLSYARKTRETAISTYTYIDIIIVLNCQLSARQTRIHVENIQQMCAEKFEGFDND